MLKMVAKIVLIFFAQNRQANYFNSVYYTYISLK